MANPVPLRTLSVGILDDDESFRSILRDILDTDARYELVGEWSSLEALLADEPWERIDVIVTDLILGPIGSTGPLPALIGAASREPHFGILVLSSIELGPASRLGLNGLDIPIRFLQKRANLDINRILAEISALGRGRTRPERTEQ